MRGTGWVGGGQHAHGPATSHFSIGFLVVLLSDFVSSTLN